MSDETCGDYGGVNANGSPCERKAGWGRGSTVTEGRCRNHHNQEADEVREEFTVVEMDQVGDRFSFPVPDALPDRMKKIWQKIAIRLEERGIVNELHEQAFHHMVSAHYYATVMSYRLIMEGLIEEDEAHGGRPRKHPGWQVWREAVNNFKDWSEKFGLTPKDMEALNVDLDNEELSDMGKLLKEKGVME